MKRRCISYFCMSLVMCVIVSLQLANHFIMFRTSQCRCSCEGSSQQHYHDDDVADPLRNQRRMNTHLNELLRYFNNIDKAQKAELGQKFDQLKKTLADVKHFYVLLENSSKLRSEKSEPEESEQAEDSEIQEICPEKFLGKSLSFGYPFFRKGFTTLNCTQHVAVKDLVTVVFDDVYSSSIKPPTYQRVLGGLAKYLPEVNVVYITKSISVGEIDKIKSNVKVMRVDEKDKLGKVWLESLTYLSTKYVLIAPNLLTFDDDINIERLLRVMSHNPDVVLASGAYRLRNGLWDIGCEQTSFRNYTLRLQGGYHLSFSECVVCDFSPGPWVARTNELKELNFDESLHFGAFHDIFWKIKKQKRIAISCPDVMFNIDKPRREDSQFVDFARKYDIKKIVEPDGRVRWYGCRRGLKHRQSSSCSKPTGLAVPPCDLENLADAIKLIMEECEKAGLFCELQEGTLLGAVKFSKVLPWERDADLTFLTANYSAFKKLRPLFEAAGYKFTSHDESIWCCVDGRKAGGLFTMSRDGWRIELYGQHLMESEMLVARGESPTKVNFAGQMVTVMRNPGLFARNRYGKKIYRHQEHWLARGKESGWHFYNPGKFERCPVKEHSACLNQFSADGNMQFEKNICPCV